MQAERRIKGKTGRQWCAEGTGEVESSRVWQSIKRVCSMQNKRTGDMVGEKGSGGGVYVREEKERGR